MRIVFVCGSLEPGCDGVGDYCRRLAGELIKRSEIALILALNDRHAEVPVRDQQPADDDVLVPVLRIPASLPDKDRFKLAGAFVDEFDPDWLSLHFVSFAFHPKGLKFGLSRWLSELGKGRNWHIMFHELWVGMAREESKKLIWWGKLQRLLIIGLIKNLKPKAIHTQTRMYQSLLKKIGFDADYLPLFGNIPIIEATEEIDYAIRKSKLENIEFVVFGAVHAGALIVEFAREAALYAEKNQVNMTLSIIGNKNDEHDRWAAAWKAEQLPVKIFGWQSSKDLSKLLLDATIGLSATALAIVEKSGSFAAMRDHGLPVVSISKPWTPIEFPGQPLPEGIVSYKPGNLQECIDHKKPEINNHRLADVCTQLVGSFLNASKK